MLVIKKIKSLSTILIWYGFTIYLLIRVVTTNYRFVEAHQINLLLLWIVTVSHFLGKIRGNLMTLLMLILGIFANASFTITTYTVSFGLKISVTYSLLMIYFIVINWSEIANWVVKEFNDKDSSDI